VAGRRYKGESWWREALQGAEARSGPSRSLREATSTEPTATYEPQEAHFDGLPGDDRRQVELPLEHKPVMYRGPDYSGSNGLRNVKALRGSWVTDRAPPRLVSVDMPCTTLEETIWPPIAGSSAAPPWDCF
jgi:hypothetical protein